MAAHHQGSNESSDWIFYTAIILLGAMAVGVNYFWDSIVFGWMQVRIWELTLISWLPENVPILGNLRIQQTIELLKESQASNTPISADLMAKIDYFHAIRWTPILGIALMWMGIKRINATDEIRRTFTMESLMTFQERAFPHLRYLLKTNPVTKPLFYDPDSSDNEFAMSLSPERWCIIEKYEGVQYDRAIFLPKTKDFDSDLARRRFDATLGKPYRGLNHLTEYERRFVRWCMPKLDWKERYTQTCQAEEKKNNRKLNAKARRYLEAKVQTALVKDVLLRHAFVSTGLMALLKEAKTSGVVTISDQHWIKQLGRPIWFALSSVGRQVAFTEAGGIVAHYMMECSIKRALQIPETTLACDALYEAINEQFELEE